MRSKRHCERVNYNELSSDVAPEEEEEGIGILPVSQADSDTSDSDVQEITTSTFRAGNNPLTNIQSPRESRECLELCSNHLVRF